MHDLPMIREALNRLGVKQGSVVFVRASLKSIGNVIPSESNFDLVNLLLDMIGEEGTLVSLAYTKSYFFWNADKKFVFMPNTPSYAGAFPNAMLKHNQAVRSLHPTNSVVAIGRMADYITQSHNHLSKPYDPIEKLIELNANMLLIGCVGSSPGFTTIHFVEQELGILNKILFTKFAGVYFNDRGNIRWYKKKLQGSCSNGFYKFYSHYVQQEKLLVDYVGNAYSISIKAYDAYLIEKDILQKNSLFALCDNSRCLTCCGRRLDNWPAFARFYVTYLFYRLPRKIIKKFIHT